MYVPGRVLDVGCGNGRLLNHFRNMGWDCFGVDISAWSENFAARYGFKLFQGTIESLASRIGKFDIVVSTSTLEHIPNPVSQIEAVTKVLEDGGSAYFCGMPNYGSLAIRLGLSSFHSNQPPGHLNFFTVRTLYRLFKSTSVSLKQVEVSTYGIPELHRFYNTLMEVVNQWQIYIVGNTLAQRRSSSSILALKFNGFVKILSKMFLDIYYHSGRFAGLGDKLELFIVK
jgi:SAM-dependent methyltransferase